MSQKEHLEAFLHHEEHLRMLATNGEDGFLKEFMVGLVNILHNLLLP